MQINFDETRAMVERARARSHRRQPRPWLQVLNAVLALAGEGTELVQHRETPWSSITFSGARHIVTLRFTNAPEAVDAFIALLPDHEFEIPGKLVADASVTDITTTNDTDCVTILDAELLLLDEA